MEYALSHRPFHNRMMPGKQAKGNLDPSPAIAPDGGGTYIAAGDRDDRAAPRGSVGAACWRTAAAGGELVRDTVSCSSDVRDHSARR
jgi:hypothetical protein